MHLFPPLAEEIGSLELRHTGTYLVLGAELASEGRGSEREDSG